MDTGFRRCGEREMWKLRSSEFPIRHTERAPLWPSETADASAPWDIFPIAQKNTPNFGKKFERF